MFAVVLAFTAASMASIRIDFNFDFDTNGFFIDQERQDALFAAGNVFERFMDTLDSIEPGPTWFGINNTWRAKFSHPGTGAANEVLDLVVPADTLIVYAGGMNLPGNIVGRGGPGGLSANGTTEWVDRVLSRGEPNTEGAAATDFGPWGGAVTFDTLANWSFAIDTPVGGRDDFLSTAIHELAHLFGFGTSDSYKAMISGGQFTGAASVSEFGGNIALALDEANNFSHWAEGTQSRVGLTPQEAALDPTISMGRRKLLTALDLAAMEDVGWIVPEPSTVGLLVIGVACLAHRRR